MRIHLVSTMMIAMLALLFTCCKKDEDEDNLTAIEYNPVEAVVVVPDGFPEMPIPPDNPLTQDGIFLGRTLFFDPILSADSTKSCASCHLAEKSFTDGLAVSVGIDGIAGRRSAISLLNVGFDPHGFLWDGGPQTLEEQALLPVEDPVELHQSWESLESKLRAHSDYPTLFRRAFGITQKNEITRDLAAKAISQFERTLVSSGNSKWDRWQRGEYEFSDEEFLGYSLFFDLEDDLPDAECGHCHNPPFFAIQEFRNNGIEDVIDREAFPDKGRGEVTGELLDNGKFKVATLRNIMLTAPYMHDGRFQTIDEVLQHYNSGGFSRFKHPLMRPLNFTNIELNALKSFLETLTDEDFINNPDFQDPSK